MRLMTGSLGVPALAGVYLRGKKDVCDIQGALGRQPAWAQQGRVRTMMMLLPLFEKCSHKIEC